MKIENVEVKNFGIYVAKSVEVSNGVTKVSGPNGSNLLRTDT